MKIIISLFTLLFCNSFLFAQLAIPYVNNFDGPNPDLGWTHSAITGTDDWQIGTPSGIYINSAYSGVTAWETNLAGTYAGNSNRVLETPYFDLSVIPVDFCLEFVYRRHSFNSVNYYFEYSTDNGNTWALFNPSTIKKKSWQTSSGFSNGTNGTFVQSRISLTSLQGQSNVKFRFRFVSNTPSGDGWLIDDFAIKKAFYNIYPGISGDTIEASPQCSDLTVPSMIGFTNPYPSVSEVSTTEFYLSTDNTLDGGDLFLGSEQYGNSSSVSFQFSIPMPPNLNAGNYYIFHKHDALNELNEDIENDNIGYSILKLDSVYVLPYSDDFEQINPDWKTYLGNGGYDLQINQSAGISHHLEGAHSGVLCWNTSESVHTSPPNCGSICNIQYLETPFFDLNSISGQVQLSFWYKNASYNILECSYDCGETWQELYQFSGMTASDDWEFFNYYLFAPYISSATKFRFKIYEGDNNYEGIAIDDFYVGPILPDISIESDKKNHFLSSQESTGSLFYNLCNSGEIASSFDVNFYWSNDSILDGSDVLLSTVSFSSMLPSTFEMNSFSFSKPSISPGTYYLLYQIDPTNQLSEMREDNNSGFFKMYQSVKQTIPYYADFELSDYGWRHNSSLGSDAWVWGIPNGNILDTAFSGVKAWYTDSPGPYIDSLSRMHLYTPVFDFTTSIKPILYFDMKLDGDGGCSCFDANLNLSYSIDGGMSWQVLDVQNIADDSYNRWYYPMEENGFGTDVNYYLPNTTGGMFSSVEKSFASYWQYNGKDVRRNTRYLIDVSQFVGIDQVQFRYNLVTNHNEYEDPINDHPREGVIIDDFRIEEAYIDLEVDYKKAVMNSSIVDSLKFYMNIANNGIAKSIPTTVNYYLSQDSLLNSNDFLLGENTIVAIQPDKADYLNKFYKNAPNAEQYKYLIYEIDPDNLNIESNELNNVGYWLLAFDSINELPYYNEFGDSIIDGWYQYSKGPWAYGDTITDLRFRHLIAPSEYLYSSHKQSGQWWTDNSGFGAGYSAPLFVLQSPSFNFEYYDSLELSFDIFSSGSATSTSTSGGELFYSIDGGTSFNKLTQDLGASHNWYVGANGRWNFSYIYGDTAILDSTYFDATFLRGEKNVVFQYKFAGNSIQANTPSGFRMDNFLIDGVQLDYKPLDSLVEILGNLSNPTIDVNYSISNIGDKIGRNSETKFYWSEDAVLDANDILLDSISEVLIPQNDTLINSISLVYPIPISEQIYYILYQVDVENNVKEKFENNNVGSFKVVFDDFVNYRPFEEIDSMEILDNVSSFDLNYQIENSGFSDGGNFQTEFYWSEDEFLDLSDQVLTIQPSNGIQGQQSLPLTASIDCPVPLIEQFYYVLYSIDKTNSVLEQNETDNTGVVKIKIQSTAALNEVEPFAFSVVGGNGTSVFVNVYNVEENNFEVVLTNMLGQKIYVENLALKLGLNKITLPNSIAIGNYIFSISRPGESSTSRLLLGFE